MAEIDHGASIFVAHGLICRFKGFWPSLPELHAWISKHWEPLIFGTVYIFPLSKGFFIAKFDIIGDRNYIMCDYFFSWNNCFVLMVKTWHKDFNPSFKTFNKMPLWVRIPNLSLHLWVDSLLEEVGEALGDFLMFDSNSFNIRHSTYARILVDIDVSKGFRTHILCCH